MPDLSATLTCAAARWSPTIGDPTLMGWITVAAYLAAAALAAVVLVSGSGRTDPRERVFWTLVLAAMLALGVNKELDLQSALTALGRCAALEGGWYAARRPVQFAFVTAVAAAGLLALLAAAWALRGALRRNAVALLGLAGVATFVVIRAAGFHHVDALIGTRIVGWKINWVLELGSLSLVMLGATVRMLVADGRPS